MELGVDIDHLEGARYLYARLLRVHDLLPPVEDVRQLGAVRVGRGAGAVHTVVPRCGRGIRRD